MCKKLGFHYTEVEDCIDNMHEEELLNELDNNQDYKEISLYDYEKSYDENLEQGRNFVLLDISQDEFGCVKNHQFLASGTKVVTKSKEPFIHGDQLFFTVDYATMFGTRLNRFRNYNSDFFICDERVLFESLIMKFRYFKFQPFYLSYPTIFREIGIKKDRAKSIIKKFKELRILESKIKASSEAGEPRQVTYYKIFPEKIIELIPKIFNDGLQGDDEYGIKHDIEKYLEEGIPKKKKSKPKNQELKNIMQ